MEIAIRRSGKRGQLMTLSVLLIFILMFSIMLVYTDITINYNNVAQSVAIASGNSNYGQILSSDAGVFARGSLRNALTTLTTLESTPSMRGGMFITNMSNSIAMLMSNGIVYGIPPSSPTGDAIRASMNNMTFYAYNGELLTLLNISFRNVEVNESTPQVFQSGPYNLSVRYVENVRINSSGNIYTYSIPVNASVSLNGTPDLFYAQQGVYRPITPSGINPAVQIANGHASYGNTVGFAYGTIDVIPGGTSCQNLPSVALFSTPPLSKTLILATSDAQAILSSCSNADAYGGIITYNGPTAGSANVPYLVFNQLAPGNVPILNYLQTGQQVMLYGPTLSVLNMSGINGEVNNESYYPSPFAPSYIARAQENLSSQSADGLFTIGTYDREAAYFTSAQDSGFTSLSKTVCSSTNGENGFSASGWIEFNSLSTGSIPQGIFNCSGIWSISFLQNYGGSSSNVLLFLYGPAGVTTGFSVSQPLQLQPHTWYHLAVTYNGIGGVEDTYLDGNLVAYNSISYAQSSLANSLWLGSACGCGWQFVGAMSNVQLYNSSLSSAQVGRLYGEGIEGLPISDADLAGWWTLDGNSNDIGGNGYALSPANVVYVSLRNYRGDSVFMDPVTGPYKPLPGVLDCLDNSMCSNSMLSNEYMGQMPLKMQNNGQAAYFTQLPGYVAGGVPPNNVQSFTALLWAKTASSNAILLQVQNGESLVYLEIGESTLAMSPPYAGDFVLYLRSSAGTGLFDTISVNPVDDNSWHQLAITWNAPAQEVTGYIDGNAVYSHSFSGLPSGCCGVFAFNGGVFNIAPYGTGATNFQLIGHIANVQFYNASLSPSQIQGLYNEGIFGQPVQLQNLTEWYPLDGNFNDYSGHSINGLAYNVGFTNLAGNSTAGGMSTVNYYQKELQAFGFTDS